MRSYLTALLGTGIWSNHHELMFPRVNVAENPFTRNLPEASIRVKGLGLQTLEQ